METNNLKGLYRRALCYYEKSKTLGDINEIEKLLEKAKNDMEKVMALNQDNKPAREKLEEIVKESVKIKIKIRETQKKSENQAKNEKNEDKTKKENKLDNDFINDVTLNVAKKVMDDLINSKEMPPNPNVFEKDCQAFKNDLGRLFLYLKKIHLDVFAKLFSKKEIPSDILLSIIKSIKMSGIK